MPCVTLGGHFSEVVSCTWEPKGEFLYSCSADQTTRIHAPWKDRNKEVCWKAAGIINLLAIFQITWHEIARPQVHGYDLNTLAVISRHKFASGADEKIVRIFEAPANFIENFHRICHIEDDKEGDEIVFGDYRMYRTYVITFKIYFF